MDDDCNIDETPFIRRTCSAGLCTILPCFNSDAGIDNNGDGSINILDQNIISGFLVSFDATASRSGSTDIAGEAIAGTNLYIYHDACILGDTGVRDYSCPLATQPIASFIDVVCSSESCSTDADGNAYCE